MDLVYFGYGGEEKEQRFIEEISKAFPDVILENCYDSIKGNRQGVRFPVDGVSKEVYFVWLIGNGWASCSLGMNIMLRDPDLVGKAKEYINKAKLQYPEQFNGAIQ